MQVRNLVVRSTKLPIFESPGCCVDLSHPGGGSTASETSSEGARAAGGALPCRAGPAYAAGLRQVQRTCTTIILRMAGIINLLFSKR